ncbi:hypothetical protein J2810_004859 [Chryseobacterium rhizosphaerae]|jgi:hypothetical protein|nr:hypothetical protein [Chryseobacterium rhizosphaerae]
MDYLIGIGLVIIGLGFYFLSKEKENYENKSNDSGLYLKEQNMGEYIFAVVLIIYGIFSLLKNCS